MIDSRQIRIVIDTNWLISACINRFSRRLLFYQIFRNKNLRIYYSDELLLEFEGVISREKFKNLVKPVQVKRFLSIALLVMYKIKITNIEGVVRDEKDDYLLGICKACEADFLITGDKDLLELSHFESTKIYTLNNFISFLEKSNHLDT